MAADAAVILLEVLRGEAFAVLGTPGLVHYTFFGAVLVWSGALFMTGRSLPSTEARVTGVALIGFGTFQVTYPLLAVLPPWYTPAVYMLVYVLQPLVPLGIVLAYLRRAADEVGRLHEALEASLTRALSQHLPICAHCKAIREGEEWVALERYVSGHTETTFSHGICPTCLDRHYPDVD